MKPLLPTLREDKCYLRVQLNQNQDRKFSEAVKTMNRLIKEFSGEKGLSSINPWLIRRTFDESSQTVVVKINREFEDLFRASMAFSSETVYTVEASGTLESISR